MILLFENRSLFTCNAKEMEKQNNVNTPTEQMTKKRKQIYSSSLILASSSHPVSMRMTMRCETNKQPERSQIPNNRSSKSKRERESACAFVCRNENTSMRFHVENNKSKLLKCYKHTHTLTICLWLPLPLTLPKKGELCTIRECVNCNPSAKAIIRLSVATMHNACAV